MVIKNNLIKGLTGLFSRCLPLAGMCQFVRASVTLVNGGWLIGERTLVGADVTGVNASVRVPRPLKRAPPLPHCSIHPSALGSEQGWRAIAEYPLHSDPCAPTTLPDAGRHGALRR